MGPRALVCNLIKTLLLASEADLVPSPGSSAGHKVRGRQGTGEAGPGEGGGRGGEGITNGFKGGGEVFRGGRGQSVSWGEGGGMLLSLCACLLPMSATHLSEL